MPTPLLNARVSPDVVAKLDALAADTDTTRSDMVRAAVDYLVTNPDAVLAELVAAGVIEVRTTKRRGRR